MSSHSDIDFNSPIIQQQMLEMGALRCRNGSAPEPGWCPETWDSILCWPPTPAGALALLPCPRYIAGFDLQANATRQCMPNGQWYENPETNYTWTDYSQCYNSELVTVLMDLPEVEERNKTLIKTYLPIVSKMSKIGYAVSFSTLLVALVILATLKRLKCSRNKLHMHLFVSFMLRAFMAMLKDILFVSDLGLASDVITKNGESFWVVDDVVHNNWQCKMFTSFWQYFILANYSWIFMEGLYLHNLVFFAMSADSNASIKGHVVSGWGLPVIFVIPWVVARALYDDTYCWTTNNYQSLFLIIRVPTITTIVMNFLLFINIVRILYVKLRNSVAEELERYKRLARSTLVLMPLFGVHYAIFLTISFSGLNEKVELVWLFGDQLFASFQGSFVAVLYCFLNGEVKTEVLRELRSKKWLGSRWGLGSGPRHSTRSNSTCSCNGKSGKLRKPRWKRPWFGLFHRRTIHRSSHSMASTQDVTTRGGSLTSSHGYLDSVVVEGNKTYNTDLHDRSVTQMSPLCSKFTDQSMLSFCSNVSETTSYGIHINEKPERHPDNHRNHRWSDSECCSLAFEMHHYPRQIP